MSSRPEQSDDLDGPWKEALEHFLEWFLAFCFPEIHAGIDWSRGYQSLDKEFQQIVRDWRVRKRLADKLFKLWRNDGTETWLLVHVEVQGQREKTFRSECTCTVTGFTTDTATRWRAWLCCATSIRPGGPTTSRTIIGVVRSAFGFRSSKLSISVGVRRPWSNRPIHLRRSAGQRRVLETRHEPATRSQWKLRLIKGLYDRGLKREQVRQLFRVLDWMMALPPELEQSFRAEFTRFEEAPEACRT